MSHLFLCVSILCAAASTTVHAGTVRAMTFNVRYGTAQDGPDAWEFRKDLLLRTIQEQHPDILGVQECLDFQAAYIAESLPEYAWVGIGRDLDTSGEMTAVFFRASVFTEIESGHFWLSETPETPGSRSWDSSLPRIATWVKLYNKATHRFLYHLNTHFDHRGEEARKQSAQVIADYCGRWSPAIPIVLTGDFNAAAESSQPWQTLIAEGFRDAWVETEAHVGPANTWNGFKTPTEENYRRIDWILVRGEAKVARCETVISEREGRYPSDHFPVLAVVEMAP